MLKKFLTVAAILIVACTVKAAEVATVNGKAITEDQVKSIVQRLGPQADIVKTNPEMRKRLLDQMITRQLILAEAEKAKLEGSKEYKERMEESRSDVLVNLYFEKYVADNSTDKHLKDYFEANKAKFNKKEVKARHILIKDEAKAKKVLAEAQTAKDFAELAKKNSEEPGADKSGGDLGFFGAGRMVPEFEKAAFAMKKGEISKELVKSQFGYHIIKVEEIKGEGDVKFETVKADVERELKGNLGKQLIENVKKTAKININDKALESIKF
jgi:parvulin-like peptidyl-prolyl isomerase